MAIKAEYISQEIFAIFFYSTDELIDRVVPNVRENYLSKEWFCQRVMVSPINDAVNDTNCLILDKIPGDIITVTSFDTVVNNDDITSYPT